MVTRNASMFVIAREARGLTQVQLAGRLGVVQAAISKIENGVQPASDSIVDAYVRELGFPASFYAQAIDLRALPMHFWRKKAKARVAQSKPVAARMNIIRMQLRSLLRSVNVPENLVPSIDLGSFRGSASDAARTLRQKWMLPPGPIPNFVSLLEDHGVLVMPCDFEGDDIDAMSVFVPGDDLPPLILLNPSAPGDRQRWSLAHELGHLVLHTHPNFVADNGSEVEGEADDFAGEFSMPASDIRPHFRTVTLERLATLKLTWKMSIAALLSRARSLDAISEYRATSLWKGISFRGWRMQEPNAIPREEAKLVVEILEYHRKDLGYADEQLETILHMSGREIASTFELAGSRAGLRLLR